MRVIYASMYHELKEFLGMKGRWIGRFISVGISLLTAFAMGVVYAFNETAQELVGIEDVSVYLLTGFFLQYIVLSSVSNVPSLFFVAIRFDILEYVSSYSVNIVKFILGSFLGIFAIDIFVSIPFLITLCIVISSTISVASFFIFLGFLILSAMLLFSVALLFSSFFMLTEHFSGFLRVVTGIVTFICGIYFPVQGYLTLFGSVGGWFSIGLVSLFPHTYIFDISRYILFAGTYQLIYPLWLELLLFIGSSILIFFIAVLIIKKGLKKMKRRGFRSYVY